jgi:hypothetical protein
MDMAQPRTKPDHMLSRAVMVLARPEPTLPDRHVVTPVPDRVLGEDSGHAVTSGPRTAVGF